MPCVFLLQLDPPALHRADELADDARTGPELVLFEYYIRNGSAWSFRKTRLHAFAGLPERIKVGWVVSDDRRPRGFWPDFGRPRVRCHPVSLTWPAVVDV